MGGQQQAGEVAFNSKLPPRLVGRTDPVCHGDKSGVETGWATCFASVYPPSLLSPPPSLSFLSARWVWDLHSRLLLLG